MKLKKTRIAALALIALVAIGIVGCDWLTLVIDFPVDPNSGQNDISIAVVWNSSQDLDAHFVYPSNIESNTFTNYGNITSLLTAAGDFMAYPDSQYYANLVTHVTATPGVGNTLGDNTMFAKLYKDVTTGPGTEAVALFGANLGTGGETIAVDSNTPDGLGTVLPAGSYTWMGFGTFYVNSYTGTLATGGTNPTSADAYVIVKKGNTIILKQPLPSYTNLDVASAVRVHMFYNATNWYVVVYPMVQFVDGTNGIKGGAAPLCVASGAR